MIKFYFKVISHCQKKMAPPIQELKIELLKKGEKKMTKQHTKETEHGSPNENGS